MAFSTNSTPELNSTFEVLYTYPELVFLAVGFSILIVLAISGNCLVLVAVARTKKLQNVTNVFVVNLSVTDFLSSFASMWIVPGLLSKTPGYPLQPDILCVASASLVYITISTSLFTLANIALNRCILVIRPMETYQWLYTPKKTALMVFGSWLIPLCTTIIPPLSGIGGLGFDPETRFCKDVETHPRADEYDNLQFAVFCPLPFLVIITSYLLIWRHVRRHFKKRGQHEHGLQSSSGRRSGPSSPSKQESDDAHTSSSQQPAGAIKSTLSSRRLSRRMRNEQLAITKNLFLIILVFMVCVIPHAIIDVTSNHRYELYGALILFISCCINPLIYAVKHPHFGPVMRALIRSRCTSESKSSSQKIP
ncbi:G-protein coupled receptor moody-like [Patiria miniata]|uniref:G-protein coupled receptors family 1 profile domain-containing protein n=1 Tax=Patiria miniata TaxID=46514 RepID=A0A914AAW2_PATMI|nr:G-protein coupled receptor moody-like [Patiria miniata]